MVLVRMLEIWRRWCRTMPSSNPIARTLSTSTHNMLCTHICALETKRMNPSTQILWPPRLFGFRRWNLKPRFCVFVSISSKLDHLHIPVHQSPLNGAGIVITGWSSYPIRKWKKSHFMQWNTGEVQPHTSCLRRLTQKLNIWLTSELERKP